MLPARGFFNVHLNLNYGTDYCLSLRTAYRINANFPNIAGVLGRGSNSSPELGRPTLYQPSYRGWCDIMHYGRHANVLQSYVGPQQLRKSTQLNAHYVRLWV